MDSPRHGFVNIMNVPMSWMCWHYRLWYQGGPTLWTCLSHGPWCHGGPDVMDESTSWRTWHHTYRHHRPWCHGCDDVKNDPVSWMYRRLGEPEVMEDLTSCMCRHHGGTNVIEVSTSWTPTSWRTQHHRFFDFMDPDVMDVSMSWMYQPHGPPTSCLCQRHGPR